MDALSRRVLELTNKRRGASLEAASLPGASSADASSASSAAEPSAPAALAEEIARTLRRCFALREEMDDAGIAPDECVLNSIVSACGRAAACESVAKDALRRAFAVYDEMESSRLTCDAYTYASLIAGCVNAGEPERALELYERSGARKVKRTAAVFAAAAHACGSDALPNGPDLQRALEIWRDMRAEGVPPDAMLYATLVDVAGRAGERRVAERVTAEMERDGTPPTAAVFAALAGVAAREGDTDGVERILEDMTQRGVRPVREVFAALVAAAARNARAGDADLAWRTYKQSRESGCPPNDVALNIVVGVTLLKIRELTDPENRANLRQQIDADAAALVDPETGERVSRASPTSRRPSGSAEPEWKEWADRAIAAYHEATVAGVRPRLATFSAMLACLRPPTLPALRSMSQLAHEGTNTRAQRAWLRYEVSPDDEAVQKPRLSGRKPRRSSKSPRAARGRVSKATLKTGFKHALHRIESEEAALLERRERLERGAA